MRRNAKLAVVALAGAAVGAVLARFRRPAEAPSGPPDDRAEELRRKLAEARAAVADEADFEAAGMGAETIVEEPREKPAPAEVPPAETPPEEPSPAAEEPAPAAPPATQKPPEPPVGAEPKEPVPPPAAGEPPPRDEFEAMRRRIHEEGRAAAEEMRRSAEPPEKP